MKIAISKSEEIQEEYNRYETNLNDKFNKNLNAINKILYSIREESIKLIRNYQEYRRYSV